MTSEVLTLLEAAERLKVKPATMHVRLHPLYATWSTMRQRCFDRKHQAYRFYGKRGITICEQWNDFWQFVADMGPKPEGTSIDRIDNDGNYEPGNCRWATASQQQKNRRPFKHPKWSQERRERWHAKRYAK